MVLSTPVTRVGGSPRPPTVLPTGRDILRSAMLIASTALYLQGCLAVRVCRGVPVSPPLDGFDGVEIWYWLPESLGGDSRVAPWAFTSERDEHKRSCNLRDLISDHVPSDRTWTDFPVIQFWCASVSETERALIRNPDVDIPHLGGAGSPGNNPPDMDQDLSLIHI